MATGIWRYGLAAAGVAVVADVGLAAVAVVAAGVGLTVVAGIAAVAELTAVAAAEAWVGGKLVVAEPADAPVGAVAAGATFGRLAAAGVAGRTVVAAVSVAAAAAFGAGVFAVFAAVGFASAPLGVIDRLAVDFAGAAGFALLAAFAEALDFAAGCCFCWGAFVATALGWAVDLPLAAVALGGVLALAAAFLLAACCAAAFAEGFALVACCVAVFPACCVVALVCAALGEGAGGFAPPLMPPAIRLPSPRPSLLFCVAITKFSVSCLVLSPLAAYSKTQKQGVGGVGVFVVIARPITGQ